MALLRRAVLDPRGRSAEGGGAEADDGRSHRGVGDAVEPALLAAAPEGGVARIGAKTPALAWNDRRLAVGLVLHGQLRAPLLEVGGGIGPVTAVGEEQRRRGRVGLELRVDASFDRATV